MLYLYKRECVCVRERERERVEKLVVHCDMNTRSGKRRMVNPSVAEKLKEKTKEKEELILPVFVRMWAVSTFMRVTTRPGVELLYNPVVAGVACIAFGLPMQPLAVLLAFSVRIFALVSSCPYIHDSQHWCLQTDIAVVVVLIAALMKRRGNVSAFSHAESLEIAQKASATIRMQFICFYASAALLKFNTAFLDARFSCATIYLIALLERFVPASVLASMPSLAATVFAAAPALIFLVEAVVPFMLVWMPRMGLAFTALFHWAIAVTPPPNDIASFGVQTMPRLLLLVPEPAAAARTVHKLVEPGKIALAITGFVGITMALQPTWRIDFAVPVCAAMVALVTIAAISSAPLRAQRRYPRLSASGAFLTFVAFVYAFVLPPMGMLDVGNASPFSSLRKHGGSNHYVLPTGVMQEMFVDSTPDTVYGEVFGGGIVRIEATNASHLTGPLGLQYPGMSGGHTPGTVALLREGGHSGNQWSPNGYASAIGNRPPRRPESFFESGLDSEEGAPFMHYTLPAAEIRRVIRDACSRHPAEAFDIEGAVLDGVDGDEEWRAYSEKSRFIIRRRFDDDGSETLSCVDPESEALCDAWTSAVLLSPPSNHVVAVFFRRLLLQMPLPILSKTAGAHRLVHCTGQ